MEAARDRRKHRRHQPEEACVLSCFNAQFEGPQEDPFNLAMRLIDIGSGGLCFVTVGRLREGVPVRIDLSIPSARSRFRVKGTVRWSQTLESKGRVAHVAGVEFEKTLEALGPQVESLTVWMRSGERGAPPRTPPTPEPVRRHKRFSPPDVELSCVPRGVLHALGFRPNVGRSLKDLSLGGAQLVSGRRLRRGRRVDLVLDFRNPRSILRAQGVVRWCRRDTMSLESRWFVGVAFTRLSAVDDEHLRSIARHFHG